MREIPKVSIIIPVYNVEKYLKQCLTSVVTQTLQEIEIICVNDGSTDTSLDILKEFEQKDSRIIIISKENTGYGNSMNVGISHATGKYIGIVESDDFVQNNMFEALYETAEKMEAEVVKSNFYGYINGEDTFEENLLGIPYMKLIEPVKTQEIFRVNPSIWSALYSREFIERESIRFHETPGASYQDVSFAFEVMSKVKRLICMEEAFLHYRMDNANSSVKAPGKVFCIMDEFHRVEDIIEENKLYALQKVIIPVKYQNYLANYYRMGDIYQYAFLHQMHLEIERDDQKGLIESAIWTGEELRSTLETIRVNYEDFFKKNNSEYIKRYVLGKYTQNNMLAAYGMHCVCKEAAKVIIFGAGRYAEELYSHIAEYTNVIAFAVSDENHKNQETLHNIPVMEINKLVGEKENALVVVALSIKLQAEVLELLEQLSFKNIITIDKWIEKLGEVV